MPKIAGERRKPPTFHRLGESFLEAADPRLGFQHPLLHLPEGQLLMRGVEPLFRQPASVRLGPRRTAGKSPVVAKKAANHLLGPNYIDVSKHHLDVAFPSVSKVWRTLNDASGIAALIRRVQRLNSLHVVCEAAGGYTRRLTSDLAAGAVPLSRVNPRQVRDSIRATGRLAKTHEIDAVAILRSADAMQPPASPAPSPEQVRLTDLVRRRRQLVDAAAQEKQREPIPGQPLVTGSVDRHLAFLGATVMFTRAR